MNDFAAWRLYAAHAMGAILESWRDPTEALTTGGYAYKMAEASIAAANAMMAAERRQAKEELERRERGYKPVFPISD